jgi:hypothetical protein
MYFFGGFSLIPLGFWPNSRVLVPCFPDFTKNSTKHLENRCPYVLIPCQKLFNWYLLRFSKGQFPMGENGRACHLCMWKPPMFTLRIGMKTMKVFIEKVRTAHHWFLPVFALKHLQQCSVYDLRKYFSHLSLVMYSFVTPPIKLKLGQQISAGLLISNHVDQSLWWANLLSSSQILFSTPFSAGALHQPRQGMWLIMRSQTGICCVSWGEEEIFTDLKNHSDAYNQQEDIVLIYALKHIQLLWSSYINLIENLQKMGI